MTAAANKRAAVAGTNKLSEGKVLFCTTNMSAQQKS
jgi:hypothetical protein